MSRKVEALWHRIEAHSSDAVDQVWHAHLTYTREYWDTFCGRVLGRPLHHTPGNGDSTDHLTHLRNYVQTLERYTCGGGCGCGCG